MNISPFIDYLSLEKKSSPNTVRAYGDDLVYFAEFCEKQMDIKDEKDVNYQILRSYIVHLSESGISARSINRKVSSIRAYFRFLLKHGVILRNPTARMHNLKQSKRLSVPFSKSEMEKLLSSELYEDTFWGRRDRLMLEMFYALGLRREELCGLRFSDVNFSTGLVLVLGKGNKERYVPLLENVMLKLKEYELERKALSIKSEHIFFDKKLKKMNGMLVYRLINSYLSLVTDKQKRSPHVLRHTFATHLIEGGADISSVKELLGHSSLVSTEVYTHQSLAKLKQVYGQALPKRKSK